MASVITTPPGDAVLDTPAPSEPPRDSARRAAVLAVLLPLVVTVVAGVLRFDNLGHPERCYFDETYYYYDARELLERGVEDGFVVHPPIGKWLIAAGVAAFGVDAGSPVDTAVVDEPNGCGVSEDAEPNAPARAREAAEAFARRFASAVAGTLSVLLTYFIGLRLFRRPAIAALAALFLALDGLALTMSRIAMLDIFLTLFVVAGALCLLVDRDKLWAGVPPVGAPLEGAEGAKVDLPPRPRWWLWAAGLCFGLALATKWSALLAIGGAGLFVLGSELAWRKRITGTVWRAWGRLAARCFLALIVVPLLVYLVSYVSWYANIEDTRKADRCKEEACGPLVVLDAWLDEQGEIFNFHRDLDADHPYRASAATWPLLLRPVAYYFESCNDPAADDCVVAQGNVEEILGNGNPALWWMALPAYLVVLWGALQPLVRRLRGRRLHEGPLPLAEDRRPMAAWFILAFLLAQYIPWLLSPRTVFLFYATPLVPFICLALGYAADRAYDHPATRWIPATMAVIAVAALLFWYPIYVGLEIPRPSLDLRLLRSIDLPLLRTPGWL